MWLNKSVVTINIMLKILNIMSLRSICFLINLDLEQVLLTQICLTHYVSTQKWTEYIEWTKVDQNRPNWTEQTEQNQTTEAEKKKDRIGPKWIEWIEVGQIEIRPNRMRLDRIESMWTEWIKLDQSGPNRPKWTKWIEVDQLGPNAPYRTKLDRIRPNGLNGTNVH